MTPIFRTDPLCWECWWWRLPDSPSRNCPQLRRADLTQVIQVGEGEQKRKGPQPLTSPCWGWRSAHFCTSRWATLEGHPNSSVPYGIIFCCTWTAVQFLPLPKSTPPQILFQRILVNILPAHMSPSQSLLHREPTKTKKKKNPFRHAQRGMINREQWWL